MATAKVSAFRKKRSAGQVNLYICPPSLAVSRPPHILKCSKTTYFLTTCGGCVIPYASF